MLVDVPPSPKFHKYELAFSGKPVEFISERTQKDGKKIIRQILLYPIKDVNNNVIEVSGIGFDITENKINEEKITQSLKEKDVLLKEVQGSGFVFFSNYNSRKAKCSTAFSYFSNTIYRYQTIFQFKTTWFY